ncbi:MAG: peptidoglycan hydrolase-like protein with peptidoglycan-binding domain [Gammaproteobacteria bacterium]
MCETNTTVDTVRKLQRALAAKGYNPGNIDGVVDTQTLSIKRRTLYRAAS